MVHCFCSFYFNIQYYYIDTIISSNIFYSDSLERLTNDQVADELENYMENQFSTELQDDSTVQVAAELLRFYQYCIESNESTAKAEFDKLPPLQSWLISEQPSRPTISVSVPIQHEDTSDEDMDVDKNENGDEWTVVTRRRRK